MRIGAMILLGALFCAGSPAAAEDSPAQRQVAQTDRDFHSESLASGGDAWGKYAAPEARLPSGSGKEEIAAAMRQAYAKPGFHLDWQPDRVEIFAEVAVSSGRYHLRTGEGATASTEQGRYVTVWRRQPDQSWRFVWDGGTPDPAQ